MLTTSPRHARTTFVVLVFARSALAVFELPTSAERGKHLIRANKSIHKSVSLDSMGRVCFDMRNDWRLSRIVTF